MHKYPGISILHVPVLQSNEDSQNKLWAKNTTNQSREWSDSPHGNRPIAIGNQQNFSKSSKTSLKNTTGQE